MKLIDFDKLENLTDDNDIDEIEDGWDGDFFKKYSQSEENDEDNDEDFYISMPDDLKSSAPIKGEREEFEEEFEEEYVRVPVDLEEQEERRRRALREEQEVEKNLVFEKEEEDIYGLEDDIDQPITLEERREQIEKALGLRTEDSLLREQEPDDEELPEIDFESVAEQYVTELQNETDQRQYMEETRRTEERAQNIEQVFGKQQEEPDADLQMQEAGKSEEEGLPGQEGAPREEELLEEETSIEYDPLLYQDEPEEDSEYEKFKEEYLNDYIQEKEHRLSDEQMQNIDLVFGSEREEQEPGPDSEWEELETSESDEESLYEEESGSEDEELSEDESPVEYNPLLYQDETEEESEYKEFRDKYIRERILEQEPEEEQVPEEEEQSKEQELFDESGSKFEPEQESEEDIERQTQESGEEEERASDEECEDGERASGEECEDGERESDEECEDDESAFVDAELLHHIEEQERRRLSGEEEYEDEEDIEEGRKPDSDDTGIVFLYHKEEPHKVLDADSHYDEEEDHKEPELSDTESVHSKAGEVETKNADDAAAHPEAETKISQKQVKYANVETREQQEPEHSADKVTDGQKGHAAAINTRPATEQTSDPAGEKVRKHLVRELEAQEEENKELAGVLKKRKLPERLQQSMPQKVVATESGIKEMLEVAEQAEAVRKPYRKRQIEKLQSSFEEEFQGRAKDDLFVRKTREQRREMELRNKEREKKKKKSHWEDDDTPDRPLREFFGLIVGIFIVVAITFLLVEFVGQRTEVSGSSMENTLHDGDNLIVDKISYLIGEPERFDIIVFPYKGANSDEEIYYIKRIIGLPGEKVQIINGFIYIDGEQLEESYGKDNELILNPGRAEQVIQLADDEYFVLGDNRNNSSDSREIGNIKRDEIVGKAWLRIWPFKDFGILKHQ